MRADVAWRDSSDLVDIRRKPPQRLCSPGVIALNLNPKVSGDRVIVREDRGRPKVITLIKVMGASLCVMSRLSSSPNLLLSCRFNNSRPYEPSTPMIAWPTLGLSVVAESSPYSHVFLSLLGALALEDYPVRWVVEALQPPKRSFGGSMSAG